MRYGQHGFRVSSSSPPVTSVAYSGASGQHQSYDLFAPHITPLRTWPSTTCEDATMSRTNQKHIEAGIKQLVSHIIPKARRLEDTDFVRETVDEHIELAHAILNEYVLFMRAAFLSLWIVLILAVTAIRLLRFLPTQTMHTT